MINPANAPYQTRTIILVGEHQRGQAITVLQNAPLGIEVVIREPVKARKADQNSLLWSGPLKDISEQVWIHGRPFSPEVWHEHFKMLFLPEDDDQDITVMAKSNYRKWDYTPGGQRVCIGSTTQLTVKGFAQYLERIYAFGAEHGVRFGMKAA